MIPFPSLRFASVGKMWGKIKGVTKKEKCCNLLICSTLLSF